MRVARLVTLVAVLALVASAEGAADDPPAPPAGTAPAPSAAPDAAKVLEGLKSKERDARIEAARQAKDLQDDKLVAPLCALLEDEDAAVRQVAIDALGRREAADAKKKAATSLNAHLTKIGKKDGSDTEVILTAQALGRLAQTSSVDPLVSDIGLETSADVVKARLSAVANIPCAEAIDALIQFLAKQGRGQSGPQRQACRDALREATGEDLPADADRWRPWWKEARKTFDFAAAAHRREEEQAKKDEKQARKNKKDDGGGKKK